MSYHVVSPAYGRDYKSKADAIKAFLDGKDFVNEGLSGGTYCSVQDFAPQAQVQIYYKQKQISCIVTVPGEASR